MLFPWARCLLWCRRHQVPMLPARWLHLRIGPFLRGELDKRMYHRLFRAPGLLALAHRAARLATLPLRAEPPADEGPSARPGVYVFRGMECFFAPLFGNHEVLREGLTSWLRPEYVPFTPTSRGIAVHVRRGDFAPPGSDKVLREGHGNYRIPIEWYVQALRAIRSRLPLGIQADVFSDGRPSELAALLAEPDTRQHPAVSAATDLLAMASAAALIGSGSTFSRWAAFLGQVPSVWFPGQRGEPLLVGAEGLDRSPEWDGGTLPEPFVAAAAHRL